MPASYTESYRVPFGDTDAAGVVFYPNYYRWFDRMTHELLRSNGRPLADFMENMSQAPVLAETGAKFLRSARYDDLLTLTAEVGEIGTRSFRVNHSVERSGESVATGFEVRIWVEFSGGSSRAVPIPDDVRQALGAESKSRQT
jgi:acyl-CoA thioester hydrolase